jgi:anthranilate phosphoribosyltransferase
MTVRHHAHSPSLEHPFAEFVRILGKGKKGSRPLTQDEARTAMRMIVQDEVLPVQLGAFLMLMRVKEETPEELAGFVQGVKLALRLPTSVPVEVEWSSYAGKRRHLPWFLLAALVLAENKITVFMHGSSGHSPDRLYTETALEALGLRPAASLTEAQQQLTDSHFSYLPLQQFCPMLHDIIQLRAVLGLRSPVHSLVRLLNPFNAPYSIQGIFHPGYRPIHQQAACLLQQPHAAVLKGEGGETERNPDVDCLVQSVHDGVLSDELWPALFSHRHLKDEQLDPSRLAQVWSGTCNDEFAVATIIGTLAIALKLLQRVSTQQQAHALAQQYWDQRNTQKFLR